MIVIKVPRKVLVFLSLYVQTMSTFVPSMSGGTQTLSWKSNYLNEYTYLYIIDTCYIYKKKTFHQYLGNKWIVNGNKIEGT